MWIFCRDGFFSAVQHREKHDTVIIRARFEGDIQKLLNDMFAPDEAEKLCASVKVTPDADYAYRIEMKKTEWSKIAARLANEIDYDNFKNSVHGDPIRDTAYMRCWAALVDAQYKQ